MHLALPNLQVIFKLPTRTFSLIQKKTTMAQSHSTSANDVLERELEDVQGELEEQRDILWSIYYDAHHVFDDKMTLRKGDTTMIALTG